MQSNKKKKDKSTDKDKPDNPLFGMPFSEMMQRAAKVKPPAKKKNKKNNKRKMRDK